MQKSRRDLLKSAVAGGLTMGVLSKASAMPTDRPDKWDASYDVIVVGAGGAKRFIRIGLCSHHVAAT